ncbi:MAG: 50S ribosomal protein L24 [Candidatus Gastranaerophilales bacterium]|nr:50S ribosomal protein L24 [Candidatus Gastranaerophilales bacterium]
MTIKKDDTVVVIAGKDKGKTGKVLSVSPSTHKVLVDGVNIVFKHKKARSQQEQSSIIKKSAPIDASNVMVVCPICGKATRVAHSVIEGKKVRVCKKCTGSLDKEFVKVTKKEAKKVTKKEASKKVEEVQVEEPIVKKSYGKKTDGTEKKTTKKTTSTTKKSKETTSSAE